MTTVRVGFELMARAAVVFALGVMPHAQAGREAPVPKPSTLPESLSPRARLADAARHHEGSERAQVGRGHPGARRAQRQHLGVSSLFPRQADRRRHVPQSRRRQPADPRVQPGGQASAEASASDCSRIRTGSPWTRTATSGRPTTNDEETILGDAGEERAGRRDGADRPQDQPGRQGADDDRHAWRRRERAESVRPARPGCRIAANGDIFVADGHSPNKSNSAPHREVLAEGHVHQGVGPPGIGARQLQGAARPLRRRLQGLRLRGRSPEQSHPGLRPERRPSSPRGSSSVSRAPCTWTRSDNIYVGATYQDASRGESVDGADDGTERPRDRRRATRSPASSST